MSSYAFKTERKPFPDLYQRMLERYLDPAMIYDPDTDTIRPLYNNYELGVQRYLLRKLYKEKTMHTFDPTKPVQTRGGRKARIICTDRGEGPYSIVALVGIHEKPQTYARNGQVGELDPQGCDDDLVNIREKIVRWVNLYPADNSSNRQRNHTTRAEADREAMPDRIACIRIEFEEGEGL